MKKRYRKGEAQMLEIVKRFYGKGIYTKEDVKKFVASKSITKEEYQEITGEDCTA